MAQWDDKMHSWMKQLLCKQCIAVTFFPLPQTNENSLNYGQNMELINLRDQASRDSGNVPFAKTKNMPIMLAVLLL